MNYFNEYNEVEVRTTLKESGTFLIIELSRGEATRYIKTHKGSAILGLLPDETIINIKYEDNKFVVYGADFH